LEQKGKERDDKVEKHIKMIEDFVPLLEDFEEFKCWKKERDKFYLRHLEKPYFQ